MPVIKDLYKQLNSIECLPKNWDGYGADIISEESIDNVRLFLDKYQKTLKKNLQKSSLIPNPCGTVSLIYDTKPNIFHLEIGKTHYSFYKNKESETISRCGSICEDEFHRVSALISL